jgi:photosystem II stability/assembly factor-like uncharacterized protein
MKSGFSKTSACAVLIVACIAGSAWAERGVGSELLFGKKITARRPPPRGRSQPWRPGALSPHDLLRAAEQARALRAESVGVPEPGGVAERTRANPISTPSPSSWRSIGPRNIGGRIRALVVDPKDAKHMWAGTASGGIWTTNDRGDNWNPVNDFLPSLAVSAMVIHPKNPDVLYAATGEGFTHVAGVGILKSTDGGKTWPLLQKTDTKTHPEFEYVNRLAISANGSILLAATDRGVYRSDNEGQDWRATSLSGWGVVVTDVQTHPTNSRKAVAGTRNGRAYYSTDSGENWTAATGLPSCPGNCRVAMTYAVANPDRIYISLDINGGEVWRSKDKGKTYGLRNTATVGSSGYSILGGQGWYANAIWAGDPDDAFFVVVGGFELYRSTNSGKDLEQISHWNTKGSVHADEHVILSAGDYSAKRPEVFIGNDGGIFKTLDIRKVSIDSGWLSLNKTLSITQLYSICAFGMGLAIAGTQDNGTIRWDALSGMAGDWSSIRTNTDGGYCALDTSDLPDNLRAYEEYVHLRVHRSDNVKNKYAASSAPIYGAQRTDPDVITDAFRTGTAAPGVDDSPSLFIAPFILDPNRPKRLLAGGSSLWRSQDARLPTPVWKAIKPATTSFISAIAVVKGDAKIIWVGHANGTIYKTTNGTASASAVGWSIVASPSLVNPTPAQHVTRIAIDPADGNRVYVTYAGTGGIWKTEDGGTYWTNITGKLPAVPIRAIAIHPKISDYIYLGTDIGFFYSLNGGKDWHAKNEGPANVAIYDLQVDENTLYAATYGRGAWAMMLPPKAPPVCNKSLAGLRASFCVPSPPIGPPPPIGGSTLRERIVKAAVGEIGIVRNVRGPDGNRQGWASLVDYYKTAYKEDYMPTWEPVLKRVDGRVGEWSSVFAVWAVNKGGRTDIRMKPFKGILGTPLVWRKDAKQGDIVVTPDGRGGSRFAILEKIDAEGYHVVSGDYFFGTVDRRIFKASEVGAYYSVGD